MRVELTNWDEYIRRVDEDFEPAGPHYTVDNRLNAAIALADQAREIGLSMRKANVVAR